MTVPTLTLADFLLARIAEDMDRQVEWADSWHAANCRANATRGDEPCCGIPARVLAECEAKRRIVEPWTLPHAPGYDSRTDEDGWRYGVHAEAHDVVLRLLALPHADHPDYRDEWRP